MAELKTTGAGIKSGIAAASLFFSGLPALSAPSGALRLYDIYTDNMVVQCNRPVVLRGEAVPESVITVMISRAGGKTVESVTAVAGKNGVWRAELPPLPGGFDKYEITVAGADGGPEIKLKNVMAGEVWLCGGQSNMEMPVLGGRNWSAAGGASAVASASHPGIRLFNGTARRFFSPVTELNDVGGQGGWVECSPETVQNFSAAGYFFAADLAEKLRMPVGIISESWESTPVQAWIDRDDMYAAGSEQERRQLLRSADAEKELRSYRLRRRDWILRVFSGHSVELERIPFLTSADYDDSGWRREPYPKEPEISGMAIFRTGFELPDGYSGCPAVICCGRICGIVAVFINGEQIAVTPGPDWTEEPVLNIPAGLLHPGANTVAVTVFSGTGRADDSLDAVMGKGARVTLPDGAVAELDDWKGAAVFQLNPRESVERPVPPESSFVKDGFRHCSVLFNAMIAPWLHFPLRGVIWYQGESNIGEAERYGLLQNTLIQSWRRRMNNPELAFIAVQISSLAAHDPELYRNVPAPEVSPAGDDWAYLREAQNGILDLPRTGLAVSLDIGDPWNIHPPRKAEIGLRLAAGAMRICYGGGDFSTGPRCVSMTVRGSGAELSFTGIGSGLTAKNSPEGRLNCFTVAGKDAIFYPAAAVIKDDKVIVSAPEVSAPAAVRYAWSDYPVGPDLYNREGFPAGTFRIECK